MSRFIIHFTDSEEGQKSIELFKEKVHYLFMLTYINFNPPVSKNK